MVRLTGCPTARYLHLVKRRTPFSARAYRVTRGATNADTVRWCHRRQQRPNTPFVSFLFFFLCFLFKDFVMFPINCRFERLGMLALASCEYINCFIKAFICRVLNTLSSSALHYLFFCIWLTECLNSITCIEKIRRL